MHPQTVLVVNGGILRVRFTFCEWGGVHKQSSGRVHLFHSPLPPPPQDQLFFSPRERHFASRHPPCLTVFCMNGFAVNTLSCLVEPYLNYCVAFTGVSPPPPPSLLPLLESEFFAASSSSSCITFSHRLQLRVTVRQHKMQYRFFSRMVVTRPTCSTPDVFSVSVD